LHAARRELTSSDEIVIRSSFLLTEKLTIDFGILCWISGESDCAITEASFEDGKKKRNDAVFVIRF
jgi:hypothetical protein